MLPCQYPAEGNVYSRARVKCFHRCLVLGYQKGEPGTIDTRISKSIKKDIYHIMTLLKILRHDLVPFESKYQVSAIPIRPSPNVQNWQMTKDKSLPVHPPSQDADFNDKRQGYINHAIPNSPAISLSASSKTIKSFY